MLVSREMSLGIAILYQALYTVFFSHLLLPRSIGFLFLPSLPTYSVFCIFEGANENWYLLPMQSHNIYAARTASYEISNPEVIAGDDFVLCLI
jgi:hypothetical protein